MIKVDKTIIIHIFFITVLCLFSLFVHRNWFKEGIHVYGEGAYFDKEFIEDFISVPHLWQGVTDGGSSNIIELSKHPVRIAWGLLSKVFTPEMATFLLFGLPCMILPVITMYWFAQAIFRRSAISLAAAFLFSFNTYLMTLQQGGQTGESIAISLFPVCLLFFIRTIDRQRVKDAIYGGLFFALVLCFDVRFAYLLGWACLLYIPMILLCRESGNPGGAQRKWFRQALMVSIFFLVPVAIHGYWIVPLLMHSGMPAFGNYNQPSWVSALSYMTIKHSVAFYHPFWGSFPNYKVTEVTGIYWIIPAFALIGILLHLKDKKIWYLALIALIGITLTKGSNPPFVKLYQWLFLCLPGFSAFRDPSKMYALIALTYPLLFGLGIVGIYDKISKRHPGYKYTYVAVFSLIFVLLVFPNMKDQQKGGTFEPKPIPREYKEVRNFLSQHVNGYHILYYPRIGRFAFYSEEYPYYGSGVTFNSFDQFFYRIDWNVNSLQQTTDIGTILGALNIKYIVLSLPYPITNRTGFNKMRMQLLKQNGIIETSNLYILENRDVLPRFYMTNSTTMVVGGMGGALVLLKNSPNFFRDHNIVYIETIKSGEFFETLEQANEVVFYRQQWDDIVLGALSTKYGIDLWSHADFAGQHMPNTTWTRTGVPPHGNLAVNHGALAYSKPGVLESNVGEAYLKTPFSVDESTAYEVWLRAAHGPLMGSIQITVDENSPIVIFQKEEQEHFRWVNFGELFLEAGRHLLEIKAVANGHHVLDQAVVVKKTIRIKTGSDIFQKIKDKPIFVLDKDKLIKVKLSPNILSAPGKEDFKGSMMWYNVESVENRIHFDNRPQSVTRVSSTPQEEVRWIKNSPTKYKVNINAVKPGTLIFSESFDPGWVLKQGEKVVSHAKVVNGRLNGFEIKDPWKGEYIVEYAPQRYVKIGLVISVLSLLTVVSVLMIGMWRKANDFNNL